MSNENGKRIQFIIEQHYEEVKNFWVRTNFFFIISSIGFGFIIVSFTSENQLHPLLIYTISLGGIIFSLTWFQINRMSKYYEDRWMVDARRLASKEGNEQLKESFKFSLGFYEREVREGKEERKKRGFDNVPRPWGRSATSSVFVIIGIFYIGWIFLCLWAINEVSKLNILSIEIGGGIMLSVILTTCIILSYPKKYKNGSPKMKKKR